MIPTGTKPQLIVPLRYLINIHKISSTHVETITVGSFIYMGGRFLDILRNGLSIFAIQCTVHDYSIRTAHLSWHNVHFITRPFHSFPMNKHIHPQIVFFKGFRLANTDEMDKIPCRISHSVQQTWRKTDT